MAARADFDRKPRPRAHEWSWYPAGWRCTKCGVRKHRNNDKVACAGVFDISGIHENHRHLRKAISPAGVPIVFCAMCGGARTGRTGGLVKSCVLMCAAGAAKDRLKRLGEGKHPYKAYNYHIQVLGPVGVDWTTRERAPSLVLGGAVPIVVPVIESSESVLGQAVSAQVESDLLRLLRQNEEELEAHLVDLASLAVVGDDFGNEDPFGFGGDFDSV